MKPLALYIHWPFCVSKCPYCDFNSQPLKDPADEDLWARAYGIELSHYAARAGAREITSIYFGGGTPSLMQPQTVQSVLESVHKLWPVSEHCEITLEANPSSSEIEKFKSFRLAGINRLSLGVQALDDEALQFLGRAHDLAAATRAIEAAAHTFDRWTFDLIYARVGQTLESWEQELDRALSFAPRHLSLYQLTIEEGTPFFKRARSQQLQTDEETSAQLYELTQSKLTSAGLPAYEVSNHASAGQESRHNLAYWQYDDYLGIGPGAHGRFVDEEGQRFATENTPRPKDWLDAVALSGHGCTREERLDTQTAQKEALMMGLRLTTGIDKEAWLKKFDTPLECCLRRDAIEPLVQEGLLLKEKTRLRATADGLERLNAVLDYLLA